MNTPKKYRQPRILHAASLMRPSAGQLQQMNWEQLAADEIGLDWCSRMYCPERACEKSEVTVYDEHIRRSRRSGVSKVGMTLRRFAPFRWLLLRRDYHRWLASQAANVDVLILRYYVHDVFQWLFVRNVKTPVVFYSHTLEVPELKMGGGLPARIRAALELLIGPWSLARADGIVGVTDEVVDYQLSRLKNTDKLTYEYPNGVMDIPKELVDGRSDVVPELLFVANFLPWHGLDDLVASIKASSADFILHVVGEVPNDLVAECSLESRIVLHGQNSREEILLLSERCWVGISSLRLDRKGAQKAATLKAPQYLSMGLPVYGYGDVLPENFLHYRSGGPCIASILEFAKQCRVFTKDKIQSESLPYVDKRLILSDFYGAIVKHFAYRNQ